MNTGMHAHIAAFPYLYVTNISIRQPCLNFTIYSSPHAPLLALPGQCASAAVACFKCCWQLQTQERSRKTLSTCILFAIMHWQISYNSYICQN